MTRIHHFQSPQEQRKKCFFGIKCTSRQKTQLNNGGETITNNCCWCCWTYHIKLFYCWTFFFFFRSIQHHLHQSIVFLCFWRFFLDRISTQLLFLVWWKWLLSKLTLLRVENNMLKHRQTQKKKTATRTWQIDLCWKEQRSDDESFSL